MSESGAPRCPRRRVRDLDNRVGEVMAENLKGDRLYLRPVGGGREWEVFAADVQDVSQAPSGMEAM